MHWTYPREKHRGKSVGGCLLFRRASNDYLISDDAKHINAILVQLCQGTPLHHVYVNGDPVRMCLQRTGALEGYTDLVPHDKGCTDMLLFRLLTLFWTPYAVVIWLRITNLNGKIVEQGMSHPLVNLLNY